MRRFGLILFGVAVVAGGAAWFEPSGWLRGKVSGEPFLDGVPASQWRQRLTSTDPATEAETPKALLAGGEPAVAVLKWMLKSDDVAVRLKAIDLLGRMHEEAKGTVGDLLPFLTSDDPQVRRVAATALGEIKSEPEAVVPALIKIVDGEEPMIALRPLSQFKAAAKSAIPSLEKRLNHPDFAVRWNAVRTLGKIGPDSATALPGIVKLLETDAEWEVREHAAEALGDIGPSAKAAVPQLTKAVDDENFKVRRDAVRSLGQIGPAAKEALPKIEARLKDPEAIVKDAAKVALRAIDPEKYSK